MRMLNGSLIRATIQERGETRAQVAADLGIAEGSLRNIESMSVGASDHLAEKISERLALDLDAVLDAPQRPTRVIDVGAFGEPISVTPEIAARLVGCKTWTIRKAIRDGELPAAKVGHGYVIRRRDLELWIERKMQAAEERQSA